MARKVSSEHRLQGSDEMLRTIEVDCADSDAVVLHCLRTIQRGLAGVMPGKRGVRATSYAYQSASVNFGAPTNSLWLGIAGRTILDCASRSAHLGPWSEGQIRGAHPGSEVCSSPAHSGHRDRSVRSS